MVTDLITTKRAVLAGMRGLLNGGVANLERELATIYAPDAQWYGSQPHGVVQGLVSIAKKVWQPLLQAMPDLERRDLICIGGEYQGAVYVATLGHLLGRYEQPWLGLPPRPAGAAMYLRYGELHQMDGKHIVASTVIFDVLDFMRQLGCWPLAPMLGVAQMWPCPLRSDGIVLTEQEPAISAHSIKLTLAMHKSLQDYDDTQNLGRQGLLNMPQKQYWHPQLSWYGPAGIGNSRGLEGFVDVHQLPFRQAFPNRDAGRPYVAFGDGTFSFTGGWDILHAKHLGGGWLGLPPSGYTVKMKVLDFYCCDGGLLRENWIPLDIIDVLQQCGVDVFAKLKELLPGSKRLGLL